MRSNVTDILPAKVRRSLRKLGGDLAIARKKRRLTIAMMTERIGVAKATYARMERGDPRVALGAYAMAIFVLGFDERFGAVADHATDEIGMIAEAARLPRRVRRRATE